MENSSKSSANQQLPLEFHLPAGFRFHPTDEELINHYLTKKVLMANFSTIAIAEVDMNKVEPWELPWKAKLGEKEWYFFCIRDKKYTHGLRTNRATPSGYWKATGKDKEIFDFARKSISGMKKTLVFYMGRAPKSEKTNWICHEYRLEGRNLPKREEGDWVISKVFQKASGGNRVNIYGLTQTTAESSVPPLMEAPQMQMNVPCYSAVNAPEEIHGDFTINNNNNDGNNDEIVPGPENPNPIQEPPSPLTQQFNDLPDIIEGFDARFPSSVTDCEAQFGNYQDYDYNQGLIMDEGGEMLSSADVRTDDPLLGGADLYGGILGGLKRIQGNDEGLKGK